MDTPTKTANPWAKEAQIDAAGDKGKRVVYDDGIVLTIAPASADKYRKVFEAAQKMLRKKYGKRTVPEEVATDAFIRCLSEGVLLGWDNGTEDTPGEPVFPGQDGQPLAFTSDNAALVLKGLKRLRDFVSVFSYEDANFEADAEALQTKNS